MLSTKRTLSAGVACVLLTGCASQSEFYAAQIAIAQANSAAAQARTAALVELTRGGSDTARVAAAFGLAFDQVTNRPTQVQQAPNEALQWASILAGPVTGIWLGKYARDVAITNSNNSAAVSMNTNSTMAGMATAGIGGVTAAAQAGYTGMTNLGQSGINGVVSANQAGIAGVSGVAGQGIAGVSGVAGQGIDAVLGLGQSGITGATSAYPYIQSAP